MDAPATTPDWVPDAIFYEIVPDRFAPPRPAAVAPYSPAGFLPREGPVTARGYQGGDLWGVGDRLDSLVSLGVTALYLTPIHVSTTHHRYKPIDPLHVDPLLGGDEAFAALLAAAHERGLRVVLDGVFHHTGLGFRGFIDLLEYGERSPWRDWFRVDEWPVRPCAADGRT